MPKITIEKYRYRTLASMIVVGWKPEEISEAMGISLEDVERFASGRGPKGFQEVHEQLKQELFDVVAQNTFRFVDMSPTAYACIEETLTGSDKRLASDNAWKVIGRIVPEVPVEKGPEGGVTLNLAQNMQVTAQAAETTTGILKALAELKKLSRGGKNSYEKHLKIGTQALPSAVQAGMAEAERDEPDGPVVDVEVVEVEEGAPSGEAETP